jgi:XTP/dITP diphosphohydrolase
VPLFSSDIFPRKKLVVATHNAGKIREFATLLATLLAWPDVELISAASLGLPEPEETGTTFAANAVLKARAAATASGLAALADDSGLTVEALNGAPGIHSARWAGDDKNFLAAMQKIENLLREKNVTPTAAKAAFVSYLALAWPNGQIHEAEGRVDGTLTFPPRGTQGFGYDPVFIPKGETRTFAEMTMEEKARHSHRAKACATLKQGLGDVATGG